MNLRRIALCAAPLALVFALSAPMALAQLGAAQEAAKAELMTQVEALSESMVQHLLRQA